MQTITRFSFAAAAVLMTTATVGTATPALASTGKGGPVAAGSLIVSSKSGDSAGPRRYCLASRSTGHSLGCHTQRQWVRRGIMLRLR